MTRRERLQRLLAERQRRQRIVIRLRSMDDDPAPAPTPAPAGPERPQEQPSGTSDRCPICGKESACGAPHDMR